ncbi:uncharacterized protein LOC108026612 isoform X2 [Drosophila biarmipes]|uniref:uncharacterized protein LOC108026612 isoform X2 n=1 Tax=Drosophila biarmipes TaxID=125945 RepID=UPI001CDAD6C1|nr:uncharacterized protein LOC108026612 isoform X2 [Drosophila biarmipes]
MISNLNLVLLAIMTLLPCGYSRGIPPDETILPQNSSDLLANHNETQRNITLTNEVVRSTDLTEPKKEATKIIPTTPTIVRHLIREKRDANVPFDFQTSHLPCDMDLGAVRKIVTVLPNNCIWAFNNRFVSEEYYRIFKTYQLEAFMFGQYHERLRRFEMDPHTWDYASVVT